MSVEQNTPELQLVPCGWQEVEAGKNFFFHIFTNRIIPGFSRAYITNIAQVGPEMNGEKYISYYLTDECRIHSDGRLSDTQSFTMFTFYIGFNHWLPPRPRPLKGVESVHSQLDVTFNVVYNGGSVSLTIPFTKSVSIEAVKTMPWWKKEWDKEDQTPESDSSTTPDAASDAGSATKAGTASETGAASQADVASHDDKESVAGVTSEAGVASQDDAGSEARSEAGSGAESQAGTASQARTVSEAETAPQSDVGSEARSEVEPETPNPTS